MTYNDRKKTPLKWNWLLRIVLTLELLSTVYDFVMLIGGLLYMGNGNSFVLEYLQNEGISMNDLGIYFWPIVIYIIFKIIVILFLFFASYGLWRWKSYGPKCTIFIFLCRFLFFLCGLISLIELDDIDLSVLGSVSEKLKDPQTLGITIGVLFAIVIYYLLQVILNGIYYHKRKPLFNEYYVQPTDFKTGIVAAQSEVTVQATLHEDSKEETNTTEVKEESEPTKDVEVTTPEEIKPEDLPKTKVCPNCGKVIDSDNDNFCDNCGAKLKEE